ncbi:hypothetical protein RLDS_16815 [Sphingobium lactosutens DS20]|uniref:Uncharacterized protein n=1 Tax=Sphingobium lactosutens DS20 TaxID=1331060 RepID=T0INM8_9SPHN|nr:hypothetical protein RLDS_16815 [Sphingobium lactosutens DS20]
MDEGAEAGKGSGPLPEKTRTANFNSARAAPVMAMTG